MTEASLSIAVLQLMKGVVYSDANQRAWSDLLQLQHQVRDYVEILGLQVVIDESEGYAYLRQRLADGEDEEQLPRLIPRRSLSFHVSLLLALLRKKLAEFDAQGSDTRLMLTRTQIVEMIRVFMPATSNEARLLDQIDAHITKVVELGFLRQAKTPAGSPPRYAEQPYEVRRILKAFVDAQWLDDLNGKLAEYATLLTGTADDGSEE